MKYTLKLSKMMKKCLTVSVLGAFLLTLSVATNANAQSTTPQQPTQQQAVKTDYPDSQLKLFLDVNQKLQPLQQSTQQNIIKSIESSGLTVDKFRTIAQSKQTGTNEKISAADSTAFNKAAEDIMKEKNKADSQMVTVIKKEGMDLETFQGIAMAYQQSPEFQQKINKMIGTLNAESNKEAEKTDSTSK